MSATVREIDTDRPVVPEVVAEHLEELAFLSIQRRKLLFSHEITLGQLAEHDDRIAAHWDGLVVAGPAAVEMAIARLEELDPWEVHAAARVWIVLGDPKPDEVAARIAGAEDELEAAWREALRQVPPEILTRVLPDAMLSEGPPRVRSAMVYARGWHGSLPMGQAPALVADESVAVRRSLARALGWQEPNAPGRGEMLRILGDDVDPGVRRAARWSAALASPDAALVRSRNSIHPGTADAFDVRMLGLLGGDGDLAILTGLLASDELRSAAVLALGDLGRLRAVPTLREMLGGEDEPAAEAARQALRTLAGSDADEALDAVVAAGDRAGERVLRGQPFPWSGEPDAEPMEWRWRGSLAAADPETAWLRREVPDGFFTAAAEPTAVPGE